jgi:type VI secretion system protein ImpL
VQPLLAEIGDISLDTVEKTALREIQTGYEQRVQPECRRLVANRYPFAATDVEVPLDDFAKAFAPGGVFAKFFEEFLVEHIDRSADQWTLRPGAVAIPRWMIQQFAAAQKIREMFFPEGAARPAVQTVATTRIIDPETTRFIMTVDGNNVGGGRDVLSQKVVDWPGKSGAVNVAFEGQFLPDRPYSFAGPWAFFRLVDGTRIGPADPQGRVRLDIVTQFHHAEVILEPKSAAASPFVNLEWRRFSCEPS